MRPESIVFDTDMPVRVFVREMHRYPYHWHDTLEIIQVLKGSVNIDVGDHNVTLHKNGILIINPDEIHRISGTPEGNETLFFQIDGRFCRSVLANNEYLFFYCCSAYCGSPEPEKYGTLKEFLTRLLQTTIEEPDGKYERKIKDTLVAMLSHISYNFDFLRWGFGTAPFNVKIVTRLKQIAVKTTTDQEVSVSLNELASEAGISLKHLSSDIKNKFGATFQELLNYSKCEKASKLLLSTRKRIIDIALECGFSDAKYFVKYFRYFFHCLPSEFRALHQADAQTLNAQVDYRDLPLSRALVE